MKTSTYQPEWYLPVRPYSPIDALNRRAAALGSPRYAELAAHADYNGHHVVLIWNEYRRYYVAEYTWAGRCVIARGDFETCLRAVLREYERGALGSSASILPRPDDSEALALIAATPSLVAGSIWAGCELARGSWWTWRHTVASACARDAANPRALVRLFDWALLEAAESEEAYNAAITAKHGRAWV